MHACSWLTLLQAITVGSQSFAFHPPTAQERLDIFSQSKRGCTQLGHIHQKAVVKVLQTCSSFCPVPNHASANAECTSGVLQRATLQGLGKQPIPAQGSQAQNAQHPGPPYAAHKPSAGECTLPVVWLRPMPFVTCGQAINLAPRYLLDLCCLLSATVDGLTSPSSACCLALLCSFWSALLTCILIPDRSS